MKLNNFTIVKSIRLINITFLLLLITLVFVWLIPVRLVTNHVNPIYLFVAYTLLLILYFYRGNQYFEYDTAGEVFNLKTKNFGPLSFLTKFEKSVDVPISKIIDYRFINGFFRTELHLFIKSKKSKSGIIKLKFNLSYMNKKHLHKIKEDLERITNKNNKLEQQHLQDNITNKLIV